MQKKRLTPIPCPALWLLLCTVLFYSPAVLNEFVWLDHTELVQGKYRVKTPSEFVDLWTQSLDQFTLRDDASEFIADFEGGGYWRPLHALSLTLSWSLWAGNAWGYHLENIFLHCLIVVLLFTLGQKLLPNTACGQAAAFWGTLWFAIHPLGVHSVTWISGRKDLLCALFAVLALLALDQTGRAIRIPFHRTRHNPTRRAETDWGPTLFWLLLGSGFTLLACASKESGAVIPLLACLMLLPLPRPSRRKPLGIHAARWVALITPGLMVCAYAVYRIEILGGLGLGSNYPGQSVLQRIVLSSEIVLDYGLRILWPRMPNPSDAWPLPDLSSWTSALLLLTLPSLLGCWVFLRRKQLPLSNMVGWFLIWLIPVSGLLPLTHIHAERYLYPASWGLLTAAAYVFCGGITRLPEHVRKPAWILIPLLTSLFPAALLVRANLEWKTDDSLFTHAVQRDPLFAEGHMALGVIDQNEHRYQQALTHYENALQVIERDDVIAYHAPFVLHINAGRALYRLGRFAEAAAQYIRAYEIRPDSRTAQHHLGLAALALGHANLSVRIFEHASKTHPADDFLRGNLGYAYLQRGDFKSAVDVLTPLADRRREDPLVLMNIASAHLALKAFTEALPYLDTLITLAPDDALAQAKYAWALWETGQRHAAQEHIDIARELAPSDPAVDFVSKRIAEAHPPRP